MLQFKVLRRLIKVKFIYNYLWRSVTAGWLHGENNCHEKIRQSAGLARAFNLWESPSPSSLNKINAIPKLLIWIRDQQA